MSLNLEELTVKQLRAIADQSDIPLNKAKKKAAIIAILNDNKEKLKFKEETQMEDNYENEFNGAPETAIPADVTPDDAAQEHTEKRTWTDKDGNEVSMSQFIREQFTDNNLSRKEISEKFDINYRTVYGATVNMENDAEPASRGRGVVNPTIEVTADNKVYTEKVVDGDTHYFLNNEEISEDDAAEVETTSTNRNEWIKDQVTSGASRGDVAKALDLSYGVVYGLTKDVAGSRQKHEVELPDGSKIPRSDYIRQKVAEGVSKSDVAKELGVEYSVVWQATKKDKTDAEKYAEAVASIEKFADKIEDMGSNNTFEEVIAILKGVQIKEADKEAETK